VRTLAVPFPRTRRLVGSSVSTRRSGRSVPARSGAMAPSARGADLTTTLPFAVRLQKWFRQTANVASQVRPIPLGAGGFQSARRVAAAMSPETAGTQRADRDGGVGDAVSCGHRRAAARVVLLGRGRDKRAGIHSRRAGGPGVKSAGGAGGAARDPRNRWLGAQRAGASKRRAAEHPPGKESLHGVDNRARTHPATRGNGNSKPSCGDRGGSGLQRALERREGERTV